MESLGNKLRTARESKGYSYDQVSRETNIAGRYIQALEEEAFDVFPGEAYLLGFLRNYGEYLGLNPQELQSGYRALKIQEQPVPVEQLLRPPPRTPKIIRTVAIVVLALAVCVFGAWFFLNRPRRVEPVNVVERRDTVDYVMEESFLERRFYPGDTVQIPVGANSYKVALSSLGETVTLNTPSGPRIIDLGQEVSVDLDQDSNNDILILAIDFSKNNPNAGVQLRFEAGLLSVPQENGGAGIAGTVGGGPDTAVNAATTASAPVVFTSPNPYPFNIQANFQGYCLFRWEILAERDRQGRKEEYFQRSSELSIQAQNGVRMGVSNAAAVKLQVIGGGRTVPLEIGSAGEVVVADIRWIRDEDGRYRLVLLRLE
ncbi:MAG: helix-turn-helix domain-containing protein [Treponema sp.]|nr:helix-turn-helix domain-containing protein [Treponema sp.]